jgi:hypothetical protein
VVAIPEAFVPLVNSVLERCCSKHGGYMKIGIDVPFKPRTRRAQGKLHSLISALAPRIDMSFDECKMFIKQEATEIGYPTVTKVTPRGARTLPQSEADASTTQEHLLIETALKIGAEAGIDLEAEYESRMRGM